MTTTKTTNEFERAAVHAALVATLERARNEPRDARIATLAEADALEARLNVLDARLDAPMNAPRARFLGARWGF